MLDRNLELFKSTFCVATRKKIDRPGLRRCSGAIEVRNVAQHAAVMLRESGASSTPRPFGSIADVSEYWIARWSLSSGGAKRRPGGGR
jgi:hypothetical protein